MKNQRWLRLQVAAFDFADKNDVIALGIAAAIMALNHAAAPFKMGKPVRESWYSTPSNRLSTRREKRSANSVWPEPAR